jgi:hypothetical protein
VSSYECRFDALTHEETREAEEEEEEGMENGERKIMCKLRCDCVDWPANTRSSVKRMSTPSDRFAEQECENVPKDVFIERIMCREIAQTMAKGKARVLR